MVLGAGLLWLEGSFTFADSVLPSQRPWPTSPSPSLLSFLPLTPLAFRNKLHLRTQCPSIDLQSMVSVCSQQIHALQGAWVLQVLDAEFM